MMKAGRPGLAYEEFKAVWDELLREGKEGTNAAHNILGGCKSTIASYRERYEREKASQAISIINGIELTDTLQKAIAAIKVKETEALEKANKALEARNDETIALLKSTETKLAAVETALAEANAHFDTKLLEFERQLAAEKARSDELRQREQDLKAKYDALNEQYNQAKQASAVASKEVEMLREALNKKSQDRQ